MSGSECQWPQPLVRKYRADWGADKYYIAYFQNGDTCVIRYVATLDYSYSLVTLLLGLHAASRKTRATTKSRPRVYQIYVDVGSRVAAGDPVRVLVCDYHVVGLHPSFDLRVIWCVAILDYSYSLVTLLLGLHAVSRKTRATTKSRPRVY